MSYPAIRARLFILNTKVLILNRSYLPIHVTSVRRAFVLLYQGIAKAVNEQYQTFDFDSWSDLSISAHDETVGLVNRVIRVPRVVLLVSYDRVPKRQVRFSRYNIYARDKCTCQYCGRRLPRHELNLDHVIPRSQGGTSIWENVVCSCHECNGGKAVGPHSRRICRWCENHSSRNGRHSCRRLSACPDTGNGCPFSTPSTSPTGTPNFSKSSFTWHPAPGQSYA